MGSRQALAVEEASAGRGRSAIDHRVQALHLGVMPVENLRRRKFSVGAAATALTESRLVKKWLLLIAAIVTEVTATLSLRAALDHPAWYVVVAVGYVAAFTALSFVLRAGMGLGVAYGIWGATGVVLTAILATILFGDPLTATMGLGIALVIGGVLCVELGSQAAATRESGDPA